MDFLNRMGLVGFFFFFFRRKRNHRITCPVTCVKGSVTALPTARSPHLWLVRNMLTVTETGEFPGAAINANSKSTILSHSEYRVCRGCKCSHCLISSCSVQLCVRVCIFVCACSCACVTLCVYSAREKCHSSIMSYAAWRACVCVAAVRSSFTSQTAELMLLLPLSGGDLLQPFGGWHMAKLAARMLGHG